MTDDIHPPPPEDQPKAKVEAKYLPTLTLILLCLLATWTLMNAISDRLVGERRAAKLMGEGFRVIRQNYVDEVDAAPLVQGALGGMAASLGDPHSRFLAPKEHQLVQQAQAGEIGGVGIEVVARDGDAVVVDAAEGMPAQRAGVLPRDVIVEVDGSSCEGLEIDEITGKIRGIIGTAVTLGLRRSGHPETIRLKLKRASIKMTNVRSRMLDHGIGYIRISLFADGVSKDFRQAIEKLAEQDMRALVLDLRFNPGGLIDEAIAIADALIDSGAIVTTKSRHKREEISSRAVKKNTVTRVPMAVLVNQVSASASEIVSSALQDHNRAIILGVTTFGKGVVTKTIPLSDGSSLALTVARYYTPKGRSIEGTGLDPDVEVPAAKHPPLRTEDEPLDKAIELLKKRL